MKLEIFNSEEDFTNPRVEQGENRVLFCAGRNLIIQPSEIMKVQTGITLRVPEGFILQLSTHPALSALAAELFPSTIVIGQPDGEYEVIIPIKNNGRNPLSLRSWNEIALGHIIAVVPVSIELNSFEPSRQRSSVPAPNLPQKKNKDVKFEIK